ncbi:hypothetical protein BDW59DRAFT_109151 [Aspergillus cavernicola]|uniref:Uncharacterized protein n=1 Tax=Aspergillus cavernicola TaxID=176166 RepID=A0ABR4I1Y6_9EURO
MAGAYSSLVEIIPMPLSSNETGYKRLYIPPLATRPYFLINSLIVSLVIIRWPLMMEHN